MTTNVLLVYPLPANSSPQKSPPLSILHVGRALSEAKERGKSDETYNVRYFDERHDPLPDMDWPDVVGVSSMTGYQLKGAIHWLKEAKAHGKRTILGGIHVTMQPDQCLSESYVDAVVLSEGEWGMLDAIHGGHKQVVRSHLAGSADHVSPVAPETLKYFARSARTGDTVLMTSRGCPFRCGFCLDGDTPVMMADLSWKPIRDVKESDRVMGLRKSKYGHVLDEAYVEATSVRTAQTYEIKTNRGSVIATGEHPWLQHSNHSRWRKTINLRPGDKIRWLTQPVEKQTDTDDYKNGYLAGANTGDGYIGRYHYPGTSRQNHFGLVGDDEMLDAFKVFANDLSLDVIEGKFNGGKTFPNVTRKVRTNIKANVDYIEGISQDIDRTLEYKRGFLAGFFDADGSCNANAVRFHNLDELVSMRIAQYLHEFDFRVTIEFAKGKHSGLLLLGGIAEKLRLFALIRPKVAHKAPIFGLGMGNDYAKVESVLPLDVRKVYDIQTETENFVANGFASHNCYIQEFFNRSWQEVDMDRWRADVLLLKRACGVVKYEHGDDWIGKWERARGIVRFLYDNGIQYRPSIRAHQVTDEVAREMKELGIKHISVGMETASQRMLKLTQKDIEPWHQVRCAEALAKVGIHPMFYWITGFPTETPAEINETLDQVDRIAGVFKAHRTPLTQTMFAYTALPGSPMFELVDKAKLPQSMAAWAGYSMNQTSDERASNLYHIGGLTFHRAKGDKTDRNFPGWRRLMILPFELMAVLRWRKRWFTRFGFEKRMIERLLKWASLRYERKTTAGRIAAKDIDVMDWGVRENQPDAGQRGEWTNAEIGGAK